MKKIIYSLGYDTPQKFLDSTFHPDTIKQTSVLSGFFATLGVYFEKSLGFTVVIGLGILGLFLLEFATGIAASKREKKPITSRKFNSGFIKIFVYMIMIAITNLFAKNLEVKLLFGFDFNIYEWLHYVFLNFVIIQYIISNLENFNRLGWDEFLPLIGKLSNLLNFKKITETPNQDGSNNEG